MGVESRSENSFGSVFEQYLGEEQVFHAGQEIPLFDEKRFYVVRKGLVAIELAGREDERQKIMRVAKPGVYFGFENFDKKLGNDILDGDLSEFQAQALTGEVVVQTVDIDMHDINAMLLLYQYIARTTNIQERRKHFAGYRFAPERIAQALLDTSIPSDDGSAFVVPLTQENIGNVAHAAREVTNSHLIRLGNRKIIEQQTGSVLLRNVNALRVRANKR